MNKRDLKHGNVVETREGFRYLYINDKSNCNVDWLVNLDKKDCDMKNIYNYRDDLTYDHVAHHNLDIIKVYKNYTCQELLWERKATSHLTDDEITILRNIDKLFKYIVRDNDNNLYVYPDEPHKRKSGYWSDDNHYYGSFIPYNYLFKFIGSDKPYLIEDLLKEN